jgi:PAS domain S-box-containing protein
MTVDADGTILFINRTVPGLAVESVIGTSLNDYLPPEHRDKQRRALERVFETSEPQSYEIAGTGPHGSTSWYFSRIGPVARGDKVVAAILITTDVTEERRAEEALRQSENRYRTLVEAAADVIYALAMDGTITSLNSAFESLSGWSRDDWLGKHFAPIIHPDDLPAVMEDFRLVLQGAVPPVGEYRMLTESGQYITVETVPTPLIVDGEVVGTLGIVRDLTPRKEMEETLQKIREELESKVERQMLRGNPYGFSFREFTVLHLVTAGQSDREIGITLGISPVTAQKHVENLRAKMKAATRIEASVRALREGLVD